MTEATETAMMLAPSALRPSARNRRTRVDDEFVASVREHGVIERLVVRPVHDLDLPTLAHTHEIVCGHRRWMGATMAGLERVPVDVRDLDDAQAAEVAIIENLHRESLTPLEEADAFRWLVEEQGRSIADVAARVHRSESYVRQRLHLHGLVQPLRDALDEDRLTMDAALLAAQTPETVQREISTNVEAERASGWRMRGGRIGRADVASWISGHWHELREAPFDVGDATLVETAGACGTCPKRTGTQGILFDAVEVADACLDEECWRSKCDASWGRTAMDAKKRGLRVLTDKESKEIMPYGTVAHDAPWVALDARAYGSAVAGDVDAPKWREIVGDDVPRAIGRDLSGHVHELAEKRLAQAAAKAVAKESGDKALGKAARAQERDEKLRTEATKSEKARKAELEKVQREKAAEDEARLLDVVTRAEAYGDRHLEEADAVLEELVETLAGGVWMDVAQRAAKRRGLPMIDPRGVVLNATEAIQRWATLCEKTGPLLGMLVELSILAHDRMTLHDIDRRATWLRTLPAVQTKAGATKAAKPGKESAKPRKLTNAAAKTGRAKKRAGVR